MKKMKRAIRKSTAILSGRFRSRTVWFTRDYADLYGGNNGGNLKLSHYFDHVLRMEGFTPKITFRGELSNESPVINHREYWPIGEKARWEPRRGDVLFLAGRDWSYLTYKDLESLPNPRIHLIQGFNHTHEGNEFYRYLAYKAIRICVRRVAEIFFPHGVVGGCNTVLNSGWQPAARMMRD